MEITTSRKTFQAGERVHFHGERGRLVGVEVAEDADAVTFVREVILEDELLADERSVLVYDSELCPCKVGDPSIIVEPLAMMERPE